MNDHRTRTNDRCELDRRAELAARLGLALARAERAEAEAAIWMNAVADVVEPLGYCREAACGPADLLPGLETLAAMAAPLVAIRSAFLIVADLMADRDLLGAIPHGADTEPGTDAGANVDAPGCSTRVAVSGAGLPPGLGATAISLVPTTQEGTPTP